MSRSQRPAHQPSVGGDPTGTPPISTSVGTAAPDLTVLRSKERLVVSTRTASAGRVRIRRRIITEQRTLQVSVRREELVIEQHPAEERTEDQPGARTDLPAEGSREPLVLVLHEQVPEVVMRTLPYEQVTIRVVTVAGSEQVSQELRKEVIDTDVVTVQDQTRPGAAG